MSQCQAVRLADRAILRVAGRDARGFLQGLITNDIDKVEGAAAIHAGLLTPQGKILFDFFVVGAGEGYLLDCASAKLGELAQRLGFYKLRAEVQIEEEPALGVAAAWGDQPHLPAGAVAYPDPRLPALSFRIILPARVALADLGCTPASAAAYDLHRIELGVPEGGRDYAFGESFPHEALFDQLNGVDFSKGCYVGQEVVSRMEHRGTARKRVVGVEGERPLPASGAEIRAGGIPIGTLGSVSGASGLALLRLDRAEEARAKGLPLRAGEIGIALRLPVWARFKMPAPAP